MSWYRTGTVTVTNGSTAVQGLGTDWFAALQQGWGFVGPDGRNYEIISVTSATELVLGSPYLGASAAAQNYAAFPTMALALNLTERVTSLINSYQSVYDGPGQGRFGKGSLAAPGVTANLDRDTGLYWLSDNQLGFALGGVAALVLAASGVSGSLVQSDPDDAATGKLQKTGAFGLGAYISNNGRDELADCSTDMVTGYYPIGPGTSNIPVAGSGILHHVARYSSSQQVQTLHYTTLDLIYTRRRAPGTDAPWGNWVEIHREGNAIGAAQPAAGAFTQLDAQAFTLGGNQIGGQDILIGDDGIGAIAAPRKGGFAFITSSGETSYPAHNFSAFIWFDLGTSPRLEKGSGWTNVGDNVSILTASLTGTTGADGGISLSAQPGSIQIENRSGSARHFQVTLL